MIQKKREYFTSRWGFILSMMGVAVGAGNIWRFSRVVAQNGGGSFIIPWVIFLFIWSIPLMIAEIAMGKLTRKGPIGALAMTAGKAFGWMGAFIAVVATCILFYYSVVVGWGFSYFFYSVSGKLTATTDHHAMWESYSHSLAPLFFHLFSILFGCFVVYKGIIKGIERSNKILIPALLILILIIGIRAVTLPSAMEGIQYFFTPHFSDLLNYRIWMEALTQNAWDTGAGWGLLLVYACYAKKEESVVVNGTVTALANNAVSLLMGVIIFATVFAIDAKQGISSLITGVGATNTGLTFIYLPKLFQALPGGVFVQIFFASIFFLAFSFAALSSMISMVQLTTQVIGELGVKKNSAIIITGVAAFIFGAPSALNMKFFDNQDWVWGLGLVVSGLFIAFGVIRYGVDRYRQEVLNTNPHDIKLGKYYNFLIGVLIPVQAIVLIGWFFYENIKRTANWWDPFLPGSSGTVIMQWGAMLIIFLIFNKFLVKKTLA